MKLICLLAVCWFGGLLTTLAQDYGVKTLPAPPADSLAVRINKGYNVGVSLGGSYVLGRLYETGLSPR